ncbi:MAG: hypothetical protein EP344_19015 [Bacteroidetes bacterium]|nr:MAG: hypothetical protein EP344_19015 [Bacteroidota bacterium]
MEEEIPVLELKPIETVQRELHSKTPVPRESTPTANEPAETAYVPEPGQTDQSDTAAAPEEIKAPAALQPAEDQPVPVAEEMKEMESNAPDSEQASGEKLSFGIWINQFNPPVLTPASVPTVPEQEPVMPVKEPETIPQKPEEQGSAADNSAITPQQLAEKSVTESKSIASETLAKLYADQGYTEKAIEMYERLILAIPGKSAYFAAQIEKLKK